MSDQLKRIDLIQNSKINQSQLFSHAVDLMKGIELWIGESLHNCEKFSDQQKNELSLEIGRAQLNLHLFEQLILAEGPAPKSANVVKH